MPARSQYTVKLKLVILSTATVSADNADEALQKALEMEWDNLQLEEIEEVIEAKGEAQLKTR